MPFTLLPCGPIEYERFDVPHAAGPTVVMLHEGLGSVSMWKDFPALLAQSTGCTVIAYSRLGHGRSARLRSPRNTRYMHDEALVCLPQFLDRLDIQNPVLFGHSDGGSIALIHAAQSGRSVAGIVALAPHVMVEDISVSSIEAAKQAYETTSLREKLARYHDDVDGVFWGWNDIWLHSDFRSWNIEADLSRIACPILAIQGHEDEYGSMEQIERIARAAPKVELLQLAQCRHSPHRDQPLAVLSAVTAWMGRLCSHPIA
jgi:pimeloyl-ACP methyl ester carboxylesterase